MLHVPEHKYSEYKKSHTLVHVQYHVVSSYSSLGEDTEVYE